MLPVETLVEIVAFVDYFELGSLFRTNKQLSDLARQAADKLRISDFSRFDFHLINNSDLCIVHTPDHGRTGTVVLWERLDGEDGMIEFVSEAFRHCVVRNLLVSKCSRRVLVGMMKAARTLAVSGKLTVDVGPSLTVQEVIDFVGSFRMVKVSELGVMRHHEFTCAAVFLCFFRSSQLNCRNGTPEMRSRFYDACENFDLARPGR